MALDWQKIGRLPIPIILQLAIAIIKPLLEQKMTVDWQGLIRIGLDWTKLARIGMIGNFCWNGRMILDRHCIDMDWLGLAWIGIVWKRTGLARIGVGLKMASDWN